jgi:UDP-3-O-[3-hydroxymyristoyl] N-acetylglucosamine deacetylase/3-hydroxyacyl-[acyl-carrier-protein] dehydratase
MLPITEPVRISEGDAELVGWPGHPERLEIIYELDYGPHSAIRHQIHRFDLDPEGFIEQIAPSRTFVLEEEAEQLRAAGLGLHLTYGDVLVIGRDGPIENAYRFENECVRHKILDLVGDLMLAGCFVSGKIYARKSGHHLNHELIRRLCEVRDRARAAQRLFRPPELDIRHVQRMLPHRYPMLLVDRVLEMDGDRRAVGIKNVTINEPFFQGHFPGHPVMPGVLIIEAMAQVGGVLLMGEIPDPESRVVYIMSLDNVKFRKPVRPGDQLRLEVEMVQVRGPVCRVRGVAKVDGEVVCEAEMAAMVRDK